MKLKWFGIDPIDDESDFGIYFPNCTCHNENNGSEFSCTCGWSDKITKSEHLAFQYFRNYVEFSTDYYYRNNHLKEFVKTKEAEKSEN